MQNDLLRGREPDAVWHFFEDICAIPHVSGDERALSDYVVAFADARGLYWHRDGADNVFIRLPASAGCEAPAVMLQGHLDMVGEKDADSDHDFERDGLALRVISDEGEDWLAATGTTLGGDDGIAVAMMLAILDNPPEPHPTVECLFTVSEETGLEGAWAFDPAAVDASALTMINLDSEDEGVLTAGCSGGMRTDITIPVGVEPASGVAISVALSGFSGGHSGVEIHEGHTNAIKALGRLLRAAGPCRLAALNGGGKDNAIPRDAEAVLFVAADAAEGFCSAVTVEAERLRAEAQIIPADKGFACTLTRLAGQEVPAVMFTGSAHRATLAAIDLVRDGVICMNAHVKGLVAYSRNLGIVKTLGGADAPAAVRLSHSTRSAVASHLDDARRELSELSEVLSALAGAEVTATHRARYPGWDYAPVSPLRERWIAASERMFGVTPAVAVIHAGLECGILCDKLTTALGRAPDIISVGPAMRDIHTPRERLSIPSVARTYRLVCGVIRELAGL